MATIRDEVLQPLIAAGTAERGLERIGLHQPGIELIRQLDPKRLIGVGASLSVGEHESAVQSQDPRLGEAANSDVGFGEYLIAGPAMMRHWELGEGALFELGRALVCAGVDCRRAGYHKPLPAEILGELSQHYLPLPWRERGDLPPPAQGLSWASRPVLGASSCLTPHHGGTYKATDYLVDQTESGTGPIADRSVPTQTWTAVLAIADPGDVFTIAFAAYNAKLIDTAIIATRGAALAGQSWALHDLGVLLHEQGQIVEAEEWWLRAADAGDERAMYNLGVALHQQGRIEEADAWLKRAAYAGDLKAANLGLLLRDQGRTDEAEEWWTRAGDGEAMRYLGALAETQGRRDDAVNWSKRAADAGDVQAMELLGVLLHDQGQIDEAEEWYRRAAEAGNAQAMRGLGVLMHQRGQTDEAEEWYRRAVDAGDTQAIDNLGTLLNDQHRTDKTEERCRREAAFPARVEGLVRSNDNARPQTKVPSSRARHVAGSPAAADWIPMIERMWTYD